MRVKKFTCHHCGAPKVNPYKNPYIVCDYCSHMVDVDYTAGLQVWNHSEEHTAKYTAKKQKFEKNSARYLKEKNKKAYWQEQYDYWDFYYTHYPEYLPPSVPKGEKYALFIKAAADMAVEAMDADDTKMADQYTKAYSGLEYYQKNGQSYVTYESFIKMIKAYLATQEQAFRTVYDNPAYAIMHEVLPEKFQLKMKLSQIAQVWSPYLEKQHADKFLKAYHLEHEYVEIQDPVREAINCSDCKQEIQVPKGALVAICEHCRTHNTIRKVTHCHSCGFKNEIPENWKNVFDCKSCNTELRVIEPLFG